MKEKYIKNLLIGILGAFLIFTLTDLAWSSVEGIWNVSGTMSVKVSIPHQKAQKVKIPYDDFLVFYNDGNFDMNESSATWSQKGKTFKVNLNQGEIESMFNRMLHDQSDLNVDCHVTKISFKGTENKKKNTINGNFTLNMTMYLYDYDVKGKISASLKFHGIRTGCLGVGEDLSNAPVISNLRYSPTSTVIGQEGSTVTVTGNIDFADPDGDVAVLKIRASDGTDITIDATGICGQTSGSITGSFAVSTASAGIYTFEVWVVDSKGKSSNKLSGTFEVRNDAGTHWTSIPLASTVHLNSVIWADNQFITIGNDGIILTSLDGINWTQRISGTVNTLYDITWSGSQFVVVGDNGTILTSPDGIIWTQRVSGLTYSPLYDITWSGTQFVAVGAESFDRGNLILTSPDGITWSRILSGLTDIPLRGITWSGTQFVAVGFDDNTASGTVVTSPDGMNWIQRTIESPYYGLNDIIWTGSQYLVVGPLGRVFTSLDGTNWDTRLSVNINTVINSVTWSGNYFVAVGETGIFTSTDGISWTQQTPGGAAYNYIKGITWSGSKYVAVGYYGTILTSP
jgi:hypothetical protein